MTSTGRMALLLAVLLLMSTPSVVAAQLLRVVVTDQATAAPVPGAIVTLVGEDDRRHAPALTAADGRASLRVPPGRYRVSVDRAGFESWWSPGLTIAANDTLDYGAEISAKRAVLDAVVISGERQCELAPEDGAQTAALWQQAQTVLLASELTQQQHQPVTLDVHRYERLLDGRDRIDRETVRPGTFDRRLALPGAARGRALGHRLRA